jgi:hypothetical protein
MSVLAYCYLYCNAWEMLSCIAFRLPKDIVLTPFSHIIVYVVFDSHQRIAVGARTIPEKRWFPENDSASLLDRAADPILPRRGRKGVMYCTITCGDRAFAT